MQQKKLYPMNDKKKYFIQKSHFPERKAQDIS